MKKKYLALLLAICMVVQLLPTMPVLAAPLDAPATGWTEAVSKAPNGYTESGADITISSPEGLAWLAKQANSGTDFTGKTVTLGATLDMKDHAWVPIGTVDHPFSGTFDGAGHEITGIHMDVSANNSEGNAHLRAGLFGEVGSLTVKNLTLSDMTVRGAVTGPTNPTNLDAPFTDLAIGGIVAGQGANESTVTITNCTVDMHVNVTTTAGVYTAIGGLLGATNDKPGSSFSADGCTITLDSTTLAPTGFFYCLIGGALGEANNNGNTASVVIKGSHFNLTTKASCDQAGPAKNVAIGGVIGKSDTIDTDANTDMLHIEGVSCEGSHDFSDTTGILYDSPNATARIGGFFGSAQSIVLTDSYAKAELTAKATEPADRFGNIAGYIQHANYISAKNVYTYGAVHQGESTLVNKSATHDITNATFAQNCPTTYYIEPQTLTEGVPGVPFAYKDFAGNVKQDVAAFAYSDGDDTDGFSVIQADGGKQVRITPAGDAVPVKTSGGKIDFTLPVKVNPESVETFNITCEHKRDDGSAWPPPGSTTCTPNTDVAAGTLVTITVDPKAWAVRNVRVTLDSDPTQEVPLTKTTEGTIGKQIYTFAMPASDVTVTSMIGMKKTELTTDPATLTFDAVVEGYAQPEAKTVTITNSGETNFTIKIDPTKYHKFTVSRGNDNWSGDIANGTLKPRESFVLNIQPKTGIKAEKYDGDYKTHSESIKITTNGKSLSCKMKVLPIAEYILTASPTTLDFGTVYQGTTPKKTVTLTNQGTKALVVTLPQVKYPDDVTAFDITSESSIDGKTIALEPGEAALVTIKVKGNLAAQEKAHTNFLYFDSNQYGTGADGITFTAVTAKVTVKAHDALTFTPTMTVGYSGGEGYDGVLLEDGTVAADHGFAEPGFFITLPSSLKDLVATKVDNPKGQDNLSGSITLNYTKSDGSIKRTITIEPYGTETHTTTVADPATGRYVYRVRLYDDKGTEASLRLRVIDKGNNAVENDEFKPTLNQPNQSFTTGIPIDGTLTACVTLKNDETVTVPVNTEPNKVYSRGLTENATFVPPLASTDAPTKGGTYAQVQADTMFLMNKSNVAVADTSGVALLVDTTLDQGGLESYIKDDMAGQVTVGDNTHFDKKYLDLVDTNNGNAVITPSKPVKVYWPLPVDFDKDHTPQVVHFGLITRNYTDLNDQLGDNPPKIINDLSLETIDGKRYLTFSAESGGPYVLVYEKAPTFSLTASASPGGSISPSGNVTVAKGDAVTFTLTPHEGYTLDKLLVDGKEVTASNNQLTLENVTANHTIEARFEKTAQPQPPTPPVDPNPPVGPGIADPDDTGVSDWLDTVHHTAYLHGTAEAQFSPTAVMTRAEVAAMFSNLLLDKNVTITTQFSDVPEDAWFHDAVNIMASLGIIKGIGDEAFAPNRPITRAEFACIAMRFAKLDTSGKNIFSDVHEGDWFYDQVIGAIKYGWISGFTDGTFRPNATISRAEVTSITNRLLGRSADQDYVDDNDSLLVHFNDVTRDNWAYYDITEATNAHTHTITSDGEQWTDLVN